MRRHIITIISIALAIGCACAQQEAPVVANPLITARIMDIARVQSARDNQLMGYGIIVGLNGTGDSTSSTFTTLAMSNMLNRLGITVPASKMKAKNVAAVMVTANIAPFLKNGDRMDITVNSLGDAGSLQGGTLLQTPLLGADGKVYSVGQGSVSLGGYSAEATGAAKTSGHPTVGRIPGGAIVEREIPTELIVGDKLTLSLNNPDFTTASRIAIAVNARMGNIARARDAASVDITVSPADRDKIIEFIAQVGQITVVPDTPARVVINERTGTVVVGGNVTVTPVALAQGNLSVSVNAALLVSQPPPFSGGATVALPGSDLTVQDPPVSFTQIRGSTVEELVRTLNAMKVSPRDIIAILQALKQSGSLQAELQII